MPNYSKIQFIAWEIYTGPVYYDRDTAVSYPGVSHAQGDRRWDVLSQCLDVSARVQFTRLALEAAYKDASKDEDTLKVFMAPEFLYRGAAGAYLFDLLNGWTGPAPKAFGRLPAPFNEDWGGLFGELRALAADGKYKDWVFVFGTAIGAAFKCSGGRTIVDHNCAAEHPAAAWNLSLIQCGGDDAEQREACYFTQKHLKSGIDFIRFNVDHPGPHVFTDEHTGHITARDKTILDRLMLENPLPREVGGALFRFPHICGGDGEMIQFGLEICLDHMQTGPGPGATGRLAIHGEAVNVQLVPSCGMSLQESSMALAPKDGPQNYSYAFNCDGLQGHVQLWCGSANGSGNPPRHLEDIMDGFADRGCTPVGDSVDLSGIHPQEAASEALQIDLQHICARQLWRSHDPIPSGGDSHQTFWPQGAGYIRVLNPQPLCPSPAPEEITPEVPDDERLLEDGTPRSVMAAAYDGSAYDAGLLAPETDGEMHLNGQVHLQKIISDAVKTVWSRLASGSVPPQAPEVYHRVWARDYANAWTSNPVQCASDHTKWNANDNPQSQHPPYAANPDGDCANYVSQAIHAGFLWRGIPRHGVLGVPEFHRGLKRRLAPTLNTLIGSDSACCPIHMVFLTRKILALPASPGYEYRSLFPVRTAVILCSAPYTPRPNPAWRPGSASDCTPGPSACTPRGAGPPDRPSERAVRRPPSAGAAPSIPSG